MSNGVRFAHRGWGLGAGGIPSREAHLGCIMGASMNAQVQAWMPAILALFGSLIVVVLTAWINTRMLSAQIEAVDSRIEAVRSEIGALRAEMRQGFAELELRITRQIMELDHRVERLEEQRGLIRTP